MLKEDLQWLCMTQNFCFFYNPVFHHLFTPVIQTLAHTFLLHSFTQVRDLHLTSSSPPVDTLNPTGRTKHPYLGGHSASLIRRITYHSLPVFISSSQSHCLGNCLINFFLHHQTKCPMRSAPPDAWAEVNSR